MAAVFAAVLGSAPQPAQAFAVAYLYSLSTLNGFVPFSGANLTYDDLSHELFVYSNGRVRIFNDSGMEIFSMGDTPEVGALVSVAGMENGDLLALSFAEGKPALLRCNFRGELIARFEPSGVPAEHAGFAASVMRYRNGRVYLADLGGMRIMVTGADGRFEKLFDVAAMLDLAEKRDQTGFKGFNIDPAGAMLFTVQPLFRAYVLTLDGKLTGFGQRGSSPGKFNVVAGIAADERGNYYVTDILKSVVIVFDKGFRFVKEFGYRGGGPGNLIAPVDVAVGGGKVFVSQHARRGVSVFQVEDAPPSTG